MNNYNYNKLKIFKLYSYDKNILLSMINKLPIYTDVSKLEIFDNFIDELYKDFNQLIPDFKFKEIIKYLLEPKNTPCTFSFYKLLDIHMNSILCETFITNLIEIENDDIFYNIIKKYSNIYISSKDIQLDPSINLSPCLDEFNISETIFKYILKVNQDVFSKNIYITNYDRLEKIIEYLPISNYYFRNILYQLNFQNSSSFRKKYILTKYIENNITIKTKINIENILNEQKDNFSELYKYILIKILIEKNKFEDFNEIINIMYNCSYIDLLNIINVIRPELISLNLIGLKKIIYYGRLKVFEFLFENIPYIILDLLSKSNPFDITDLEDISYTEDIWDSKIWYERESEKVIIGRKQHKELIDLILKICAEKNYNHVIWTDEIKKYWISLALQYKLEINYQDSEYFIQYEKLLEIFNLKFELNNKESIQTHIKMFGKKSTWNWIKESSDENFLDLFFDVS